jgi:UDP-N-acetylglucosamine 2-epimerase
VVPRRMNKIIRTIKKLISLTQDLQAYLPTNPNSEQSRLIREHLERAKIELLRALREAESK